MLAVVLRDGVLCFYRAYKTDSSMALLSLNKKRPKGFRRVKYFYRMNT